MFTFLIWRKTMIPVSQFLLTLLLTLPSVPATQPAHQEDEQAIRRSAAQYAEAFNRSDIDALANQYAKDATYDEDTGEVIVGRDEIRKKLAQNFAENPGVKMAIEIKSIRFTKSRAIEIGVATLTPKKGEPTTVPYRAVHARLPDGRWLITSVGPDVTAENATSAGPLEQLAWMIGNWQDSEKDVDITSVCTWTTNRRFIIRSFVVKDENRSDLQISEVIGWDPFDHVFRSWVFDSDGGFGQSTWSSRKGDWILLAEGTLPDGGRGSAVNIIHPIDNNSYTWSSTNRDVDGTMLPDVSDIKMVRVPATQPAARSGEGK
jgi:uncharacterized protein (TIGR02246 family)